MPMPLDVTVDFTDGTSTNYNIALEIMRGNKATDATILKDRGWAYPTYSFTTEKSVKKVTIVTNGLLADINLDNNVYEAN